MHRFGRYIYQPVSYMGRGGKRITGCKEHVALSKTIATEGTVLLKNDGILPLSKGIRIVPFGRGYGDFILGGGGSGVVYCEKSVPLADSLLAMQEKGEIEVFSPLIDHYRAEAKKEYDALRDLPPKEKNLVLRGSPAKYIKVPAALYEKAKKFGGVALYCLSRFSGESADRPAGEGGFALLKEEIEEIDRLIRDFDKVVVILNICGMTEVAPLAENPGVSAILYPAFGGMMAGESLTDLLFGISYPSGRLQDTFARKLEDYPSTESFLESPDYVNYTEDIFVGYRYFETFCPEKVIYPFGYGLGYTDFALSVTGTEQKGTKITLTVSAENTGIFPGKEVVQVYLSAPQGKLGKAAKVLCAFEKTKELMPEEEQTLSLSFDLRDFASFDDLGKIEKSAFILEKGEYTVFVGKNVRDCEKALSVKLKENEIVKKCHSYMVPTELKERLLANGKMEKLPQAKKEARPLKMIRLAEKAPEKPLSLVQALDEDRLDAFLDQLSPREIGTMLYGHTANNASMTGFIGLYPDRWDAKAIPQIPTADGPAGLRIPEGRDIFSTYFPCAMTVAQSWNPALCRKIGAAGAKEVKENNIGIWLTPALNIHRSPLCGRNFEYYSEDPFVSGIFAAAAVKGIQSQKIAACIKHFCCNDKETNRKQCDSRVSERAIREIYLRGFEIVVKKAHPWTLMTSYNKVNGARSSANWDAINGILRGEWGYDGVVMTDWNVHSTLQEEISAGSDVKMPSLAFESNGDDVALWGAIADNSFPRRLALASVRRILKMMGKFE